MPLLTTRQPQTPAAAPSSLRLHTVWPVLVMCVAVLAVYCPPSLLFSSERLVGYDFSQLHVHRVRYAQAALFGEHPHLPAWHSRELLGSPFWSNTQSFPFIPTRLLVLLCDPFVAFAVGINVAALLAALFTYLFLRSLGIVPLAAAVAGWTFAAAGFYASRVMAGHLPLLEAYPALPLLLWLIECCLRKGDTPRQSSLALLALGLATTSTVLAGHPQVPAYAVAASFVYLLCRGAGGALWRPAAAMICGAGIAAFALFPMFQLIQRSTRVLRLDEPGNNVYLPYGRLLAFLFPWRDGAAPGVQRAGTAAFQGYPNMAYFWDTVCYMGWLPVLAVVFLLGRAIVLRRMPARPWLCIAVGGFLALLFALPFVQHALSWIPGTILRSPSRQLYVTTFALAVAIGIALNVLVIAARGPRKRWAWAALAVLVALHLADVGAHARSFIQATPAPPEAQRVVPANIASYVGHGRIALDNTLPIGWTRQLDDVGFFDSIMLAKSYTTLLALNGASPRLNIQEASGSAFNARYLGFAAVRLVITTNPRPDLVPVGSDGAIQLYSVPTAVPRAHFFPRHAARFLSETDLLAALRDPAHDVRQAILLPSTPDSKSLPSPEAETTATVEYRRPSSDSIALQVKASGPGFLRIVESWDRGWSAWVDGRRTDVLCADGALMAVPVDASTREVRLQFATPGARTGTAVALVSLVMLIGIAGFFPRRR